jgi:hypothetical protein
MAMARRIRARGLKLFTPRVPSKIWTLMSGQSRRIEAILRHMGYQNTMLIAMIKKLGI